MKKGILVLIFFSLLVIGYSADIFVNLTYSLTHSAQSTKDNSLINFGDEVKLDYFGARVSYLISTEDTDEISYGPYLGVFYNYQINENDIFELINENKKSFSIALGLNVRYKTNIFIDDLYFTVAGYGGVHSIDLLETFSTEILIKGGLNYNRFFITAGYETKYFKVVDKNNPNNNEYISVNYFPISLGVNFQF